LGSWLHLLVNAKMPGIDSGLASTTVEG